MFFTTILPENVTTFITSSLHLPIGENKHENKSSPPPPPPFKLPIQYLEESDIHTISNTVSNDLELIKSNVESESEPKPKPESETSMYHFFSNPSNAFAKQMIPQTSMYYTTNIDYLKETQEFIREHGPTITPSPINCDKITDIWKDIKYDEYFLEKYSYMEWQSLLHLNESATFLQCLSMINFISPLISFILPFILLIFPFVLLKIQGIPITFSIYLDILKEITKHHFIGKLFFIESFSIERIAYLAVSAIFYFLQIYQQITSFIHFYENTKKINESLLEIRNYTKYSITIMENFLQDNKKRTYYQSFCQDMEKHRNTLKKIHAELVPIRPFSHSISTINDIGYMLKCFYDLHVIEEYHHAIQWSISFDGYIQIIRGIYENIHQEHIHFIEFSTDEKPDEEDDEESKPNSGTKFIHQYYPPFINTTPVKNTCDLSTNLILTGPNASGKTTFLKTAALNILFSQQFGCGFYDNGSRIHPYSHIHSYINIPDTSQRDSLFQAESRRCKDILDCISSSNKSSTHFCIFDELYSGTNPTEATKSGFSFLNYLAKNNSVDFILTTHYIDICDQLENHENIENYMMNVEEENGNIKYTYEMKKGISRYEGAIHVFKEMNYPEDIIEGMK
jgi:hypothetical protein